MQGGQGPGGPERGVYVVRRLVAVLVILLLLVLLVPRACQALLGSGEEPGPGAPETSVTGEDTTSGTEETVEQGSTAVSSLEEETETESSTSRTTSGVQASKEESSEALGVETATNLTGMVVGFEPLVGESGVGEANQIAPIPDIGTQQVVQPISFEQPIAFEPIPLEAPVFFEEPSAFGESVFSEEETPSNAPTATGPVAAINSDHAKSVVPAKNNAQLMARPIHIDRPDIPDVNDIRNATQHNDLS